MKREKMKSEMPRQLRQQPMVGYSLSLSGYKSSSPIRNNVEHTLAKFGDYSTLYSPEAYYVCFHALQAILESHWHLLKIKG